MRSYTGQLSDNQPIRRNLAEKQKQLRDLKETLGAMKPHTSPTLRESIQRRIRELEVEIRAASKAESQPQDRPRRDERPRRAPRRAHHAETFGE
ncbi:hypothetical protein [Swaminathania salitolerans]|uniref:Uncharacterized protein n=1 Tax=Swaminathania salitolerans TaxID=182838 RepID=A0A511BTT2_9PROT|nr:hypothetical protein [Swaminathania salitolerans]GBQ15492.1 hypothetical protein AA21291_2189 [Swaminathania salitolerans LMG 21291]GEL01378.1 hypothetical protein SSA02_05410 [Swaminathania salitolerans]